MSVNVYPFHSAQAMKRLYQSNLDAAKTSGAVTALEHDWLTRSLSYEPNPNNPVPVHASSLFLSRHQCRPAQWAGAFLLTPSLPEHASFFC